MNQQNFVTTEGFAIKRPTPVSAISPVDIPGLTLWLKADSGDLVTTHNGSTPVSDGSNVGKWPDQSGNAIDAIQSLTRKPVFRATGGPNSTPTVEFTDVSVKQNLIADGLASIFGGDQANFTVLTVYTFTNIAPADRYVIWGAGNDSDNVPFIDTYITNTTNLYIEETNDNNDNVVANGSATETANTFSSLLITGGSTILGYKNGVPDISLAVSGAMTTTNRFTIGALRHSSSSSEVYGSKMKVSEIIAYNSALTTSQLNQLGNYVAAKYGITWTTINTNKAAQNAGTSSNWLDAGNAAGLRVIGTDTFIIGGWIKWAGTVDSVILAKGDQYNGNPGSYDLSLTADGTNGYLTFEAYNGTSSISIDAPNPVVLGTKSFFVAWATATGINVRIDNGTTGTFVGARSNVADSGTNFVLFALPDGSLGTKCVLDEVFFCKNPASMTNALSLIETTIYNSGSGTHYANLTAGNITTLGLVSWWGLDEAAGATRKDLNSTNDLTLHGTITQVTSLTA